MLKIIVTPAAQNAKGDAGNTVYSKSMKVYCTL